MLNTLNPDSYIYWNRDVLEVPGPGRIYGSLNIFHISTVRVMEQNSRILLMDGSVI